MVWVEESGDTLPMIAAEPHIVRSAPALRKPDFSELGR